MKVLSEKDIQKLATRALKVTNEAGAKVQPFLLPARDEEEPKKEKVNWLKLHLGLMTDAIQEASTERKALNKLMGQVLKKVAEPAPAPKIEVKTMPAVAVPAKKWKFTIHRDDRGFISEVEADRIN